MLQTGLGSQGKVFNSSVFSSKVGLISSPFPIDRSTLRKSMLFCADSKKKKKLIYELSRTEKNDENSRFQRLYFLFLMFYFPSPSEAMEKASRQLFRLGNFFSTVVSGTSIIFKNAPSRAMWHSLIASGAAELCIFLTTVLVTNGGAERRSEVILSNAPPTFPHS